MSISSNNKQGQQDKAVSERHEMKTIKEAIIMTNDTAVSKRYYEVAGEIRVLELNRRQARVLRGQYVRRANAKDSAQEAFMAYHQSAEAEIHLPVPDPNAPMAAWL